MTKITQTCDYTSKAKIQNKQSRKKHTIVYHTYENMLQNAEMKQSKNTIFILVWHRQKKAETTPDKSPNPNANAYKKNAQKRTRKHKCKSAKFVHACAKQPVPRRVPTLRVRNCQSINFLWFFKIKTLTNQIRDVFLLVNMGVCRHCVEVSEFNKFVRVQY